MNHVYFLTRLCLTGMNHYRCYRETQLIAQSTVPYSRTRYPVLIRAGDTEMTCLVDPEKTVFPGAENEVTLPDGTARVIYDGRGSHRLILGRYALRVREEDSRYRFFLEGRLVAVMNPVPAAQRLADLEEGNWSPRLVLMAAEPLPERLAVLMLHFPLLQVAP